MALSSKQEEVSTRVTNLLSSIEDWEKSLQSIDDEDDDKSDDPDGQDEAPESRGGGLFSLGE